MSYEQYWDGDCELVRAYRKAAKIRRELANQDAWMQGAYFYEALVDVAPLFRDFARKGTKATPYRRSPFPLFEEQEREQKKSVEDQQDEKAKAFFQAMAESFNQNFKKKGGEVNGRQCGDAGT